MSPAKKTRISIDNHVAMITQIPKSVKLYSSFLSLPKYASLYFLARSADIEGSGKVIFDIKDLMGACDRTRPTINGWIKDCCAAGFFRYCKWLTRSTVIIYYTNLNLIALSKGIADIGLVTDVPLEVFRSSLHIWMTECVAMNLQDQSVYKMYEEEAKKQNRKRPRVNTPADIFNAKPKELHTSDFLQALSNGGVGCNGKALVYRGERCAFVSPNFTLFGGSQSEIAKRAGLTPRTIQRHLGDDYRLEKGLEPMTKYQLAVAVSKATTEHKKVKQSMDDDYNFVRRLFVVGRGENAIEFFAGCNVYQSEVNYRYSDRRATKIRKMSEKITNIPNLMAIEPIKYTK